MNYLKIITVGMAATAAMAIATQAATIVQWGELGGEEIVTGTGNKSAQNALGASYNDTLEINPSPGQDGYYVTNPLDRTTVFYGAQSQAFNTNVFVNSSPGDYAQIVANSAAAFDAMVAWDTKDGFLGAEPELESYSIEYQRRGSNTNISFLLETTSGWYVTDQSVTTTDSTWTSYNLDVSSATWTSYSGFGVTGGAGAPDLEDIQSVGFRVQAAAVSGWDGARVRHFEVTAIPEPSSAALLGLGGLALICRCRKSQG